MLDPRHLEIVKATVPAIASHGEEVTRTFYAAMLAENPELFSQFNVDDQKNGAQPKRLAQTILAYAANIDKLGNLGPAVEKIAQRHCDTNVRADQYPLVGKYLLQAMKSVLGDAITPEVLEAWTGAYQQIAEILIAREAEIYAQRAEESEAAVVA
jgi:nitric oxide dioxygenase